MERVQHDEQWSLFCPNEAPGLADSWGDMFQNLNDKYACIFDSFKVTKDV
jgi:ribonucleoside-diphosphate reductase subunit M1